MFNNILKLWLSFFTKKANPAPLPKKVISEAEMMAAVDKRDIELYLDGPSAFWNNPNRYQPDGTYDIFAEPYQRPVVATHKKTNKTVKSYGDWKYVNKNTQIQYSDMNYNTLLTMVT